jgi:hypothetical protein
VVEEKRPSLVAVARVTIRVANDMEDNTEDDDENKYKVNNTMDDNEVQSSRSD